jgi:hypothetical protein
MSSCHRHWIFNVNRWAKLKENTAVLLSIHINHVSFLLRFLFWVFLHKWHYLCISDPYASLQMTDMRKSRAVTQRVSSPVFHLFTGSENC